MKENSEQIEEKDQELWVDKVSRLYNKYHDAIKKDGIFVTYDSNNESAFKVEDGDREELYTAFKSDGGNWILIIENKKALKVIKNRIEEGKFLGGI